MAIDPVDLPEGPAAPAAGGTAGCRWTVGENCARTLRHPASRLQHPAAGRLWRGRRDGRACRGTRAGRGGRASA